MLFKQFLLTFSLLALFPTIAHAYVDPGLVSMVLQGVFAAIAGFVAVYVIGPWQWLKSLFKKSPAPTEAQSDNTSGKTK